MFSPSAVSTSKQNNESKGCHCNSPTKAEDEGSPKSNKISKERYQKGKTKRTDTTTGGYDAYRNTVWQAVSEVGTDYCHNERVNTRKCQTGQKYRSAGYEEAT